MNYDNFNNLNNQSGKDGKFMFEHQQQNFQPSDSNNLIVEGPKKKKYGLLVIIFGVLVGALVGVFLFNKDSNDNKQKKDENIKSMTYFNESGRDIKDKLMFNLEENSNYGKGLFFGVKGAGISKNLKIDSWWQNGIFGIDKYEVNDEISFSYDGEFYYFQMDVGIFLNDENGENLDNLPIVYKEDDYIVRGDNDFYVLYYIYSKETYFLDHSKDEWSMVRLAYSDSLEEAKKLIKKIKNEFNICVYDRQEGYDSCVTSDGESFNYKEYKHIYDVFIDSLIDYNLYLDSYENIVEFANDGLVLKNYIHFEDIEKDDFSKFKVDYEDYFLDPISTVKINNIEFKIDKYYNIAIPGYAEVSVSLPYKIEENVDNVTRAFKETFSKEK